MKMCVMEKSLPIALSHANIIIYLPDGFATWIVVAAASLTVSSGVFAGVVVVAVVVVAAAAADVAVLIDWFEPVDG